MPSFCHSCGGPLVSNAAFCSACGTLVSSTGTPELRTPAARGQVGQHGLAVDTAKKSARRDRIVIGAIIAGVGVLLLLFVIGESTKSESNQSAQESNSSAPSDQARVVSSFQVEQKTETLIPETRPPLRMPTDELAFVRAVKQGQVVFRAAPNEMAQGGTRSQRRLATCQVLTGLSVAGWVGQIEKLSSNSDGKGVLEISIGDSIRVETWNNDLSDVSDRTLIDPTSVLFSSLSQMKEHDRVVSREGSSPATLIVWRNIA